jgi:hypothetical protein
LTCLLSDSASLVDPRLAGVEGLIDDVAAADSDDRLDKVFTEQTLVESSGRTKDSDALDSDIRRSRAWLVAVRQRLGGGDEDAYSQLASLERIQLLHGDSRLHFIFRLRHSVHELYCQKSVDIYWSFNLLSTYTGGLLRRRSGSVIEKASRSAWLSVTNYLAISHNLPIVGAVVDDKYSVGDSGGMARLSAWRSGIASLVRLVYHFPTPSPQVSCEKSC